MPSLRQLVTDYALPVGSQIAGGLIARRGVGNATRNLRGGATNAMNRVNAGYDAASKTMGETYDNQRLRLNPFIDAGRPALDNLSKGTETGGEFNRPFTMADFELYKDPGFQWRVQQGERAIKAGANAGGIRFSGATLKALSGYNQDMASQEAGAAYGRYRSDVGDRFERLMGVSGIGERAAGSEVDAGSQYGANLARLQQSTAAELADLETELANANAAGDMAKANSITDTINGILQSVEGVGTSKLLEKLIGGAGTAAGVGAAAGGAALPAVAPEVAALAGMNLGPGLAAGGYASAGGGAAGGVASALGSAGSAIGTLGGLVSLSAGIPIIGGVIAGGILASKLIGRGRKAADVLTKEGGMQREFENVLKEIDAEPLPPEQKWAAKTAEFDGLIKLAMEHAAKGSQQRRVVWQMFQKISPYFGRPNPLGAAA